MKVLINGGAELDHTSVWRSIRNQKNVALQLCWDALTGTLDAAVKVIVSNDKIEPTTLLTRTITTANNAGDRLLLEIDTHAAYYCVVYLHNNVSGGTLKVTSEEEG